VQKSPNKQMIIHFIVTYIEADRIFTTTYSIYLDSVSLSVNTHVSIRNY